MRKTLLLTACISAALLGCQSTAPKNAKLQPLKDYQQARVAVRLQEYENNIDHLLAQMTLDEKISLIHANAKFSIASIERLGIHEMWMSDGPHGVRYEIDRNSWGSAGWTDDHSTYLPNLTSVASSWDPEMARLHGNILGSEARHRRKDLILGPGVNMARLTLYGRNFEYMGEDPFLAASMVVPEVQAIQANDVAATVKHYALNTQELNRTGVDARPDERTLREVYLPAFEAAVKEGGVHAIMGSYNNYYGTNANQSKHLIMDILKGEWDYQGLVVTDWNVDINSKDAGINGLDIEMGTVVDSYDDYFMAQPLKKLVEAGDVPEAAIDDKVRRILRVQYAIGMMDKYRLSGQRNTDQHRRDAQTIAENGIVLLKNEGVLPFSKQNVKRLLVMGPNADKRHGSGGGSSEIKSLYEVTPLEGLQNLLGDDVEITYMRARPSEGFLPIAPDYVTSRHWTGTPAWTQLSFASAKDKEPSNMDWVPLPEFNADGQSQYVVYQGSIKPVKTGEHALKIKLQGKVTLLIDGKAVYENSSSALQTFTHAVDLNADQQYQIEIRYQGKGEFALGWDAPGSLFTAEQDYMAAAKQADAVIYFGGLSHGDDREAIDRKDMRLPMGQDKVLEKLLTANPNTAVFIVAGSAVELPWAEQANAVAWGWYAGMEAGNAFASMLFGDVNPGGKMPISLPASLAHTAPIMLDDYNAETSLYKEGVFIGYRWLEKNNLKPVFPFGHGLSYSEFEYSDIQLSRDDLQDDQVIRVSATIKNTGKVAGSEVVQLYLYDQEASVERPLKELKGFQKVWLAPGESQQVDIVLTQRDLSFWDVKTNDWLAEPGEFTVYLSSSVEDVRLQSQFTY